MSRSLPAGLLGFLVGPLCASLFGSATARADPLDLSLTHTRGVLVEFENTQFSPGTVGASWGTPYVGVYSVSNGIGTVALHPQVWATARSEGTNNVPMQGTFSGYLLRIDLATGEATTDLALGSVEPLPGGSGTWAELSQQPLSSSATAGFYENTANSLVAPYCPSQAWIDLRCLTSEFFCDKTCTLVNGTPYDPGTGTVNMVGIEHVVICDQTCGPLEWDGFAIYGDVRLSEDGIGVPAMGGAVYGVLAAALGLLGMRRAGGSRALRRRSIPPGEEGAQILDE